MRRISALALAAGFLGALASSACLGGQAVGNGTCSGVSGGNHAYVVVLHGSHKVVDRCVGFDKSSISGMDLMKASKLQYATQNFGSLGAAFCAIDGEPAHYAGCLPANSPYWSDWVYQGGHWKSVLTSFSKVSVNAGGALGWVYTPPTGNPPQPPAPPSS